MPAGLTVAHGGFVVLAGWVLGVALQLQQPALWAGPVYVAILLLGASVVLALAWPRAIGSLPRGVVLVSALLAGALVGAGLTGARAVHFAAGALDPALQGIDIEVTGRIASLPRRSVQGERFEFLVDTARRDGVDARVPERLQLGWYGGPIAGAEDGGWALATVSPGLRAGERWRFTVRLRSPHGNANPHGFDRERCSVGSFV
ncbi:ComEC/Rec2 family competence protein [Hydrogenophaga sp.]|uniref:ComEC/Rec2 family competence protein n=1 Tax=Hydrogenophaga sp. TaxID=1904254 RepID=UPI003D0B28A9